MSFYDGVKDTVREEHGDEPTEEETNADNVDEAQDMPFDQLKENANTGEQEQSADQGDDTQIEVLTENGLESANEQQETAAGAGQQPQQSQKQPQQHLQEDAVPAQQDDVVTVLQEITEQNDQIISLLRSIEQRLN